MVVDVVLPAVLGLVLVREAGVEALRKEGCGLADWDVLVSRYSGIMVFGGLCVLRTGCEDVSVCLSLSLSLSLSTRRAHLLRTSHELEGHGHALLVVRHVCGISRGVRLGGVLVDWRSCAVVVAVVMRSGSD